MSPSRRIDTCRGCGSGLPETVLDLGPRPRSDGLQPTAELALKAERCPLELALCGSCGLLQLLETPPPSTLFGEEFRYYSSVNPDLLAHAGRLAETLVRRLGLDQGSRVIELASNDGYLLRHFARRGMSVIGVDPAPGPAAAAVAAGIETIPAFFDGELAERLREEGGQADLIVANNVLAHVPDPADFLAGVARLLRPGGTAVFEVAWGRSLLHSLAFDQIYHEHHSYFTVGALDRALDRAGLKLIDVETLPIHAGSLRVFAAADGERSRAVDRLIRQEQDEGLARPEPWRRMGETLLDVRRQLRDLLDRVCRSGLRLAAYGAAAKGTMLLNWLEPEPGWIPWIADINPHKHGRFVPGVAIPVVGPERIAEERPDRLLLLPWNWAAEIARDQQAWLAGGGRFIVPLPRPRLYP
ncbi:MAG: class I SAM-dependent methyltransferase [Wenzhouxiangella sp.]|nr:class I SAM-dependent methyltransferase [Wenzhouxiangella sp.]